MFLTSPIFGAFGLSLFFNGILPLNAYGMPMKLDPSFSQLTKMNIGLMI